MATLCFSPTRECFLWAEMMRWAMPTDSRSLKARSLRFSRERPLRMMGTSTFSRTLIYLEVEGLEDETQLLSSNTGELIIRGLADVLVREQERRLVGRSRQPTCSGEWICRCPDGPIRAMNSPFSICRLMPLRTANSLSPMRKVFWISFSSITFEIMVTFIIV